MRLVARPASSAVAVDGARAVSRATSGSIVLAAAVPFLFLHERYQPDLELGIGSTSATADLSDLALLAVVVTALWSGTRSGFGPLRPGRWLWAAVAGLLAWIAVESARDSGGATFSEHAVTAARFAEYAALALAVPLIVRQRRDLRPLAWAVVLWAAVASGVALLQFAGTPIFDAWKAGWRQPSFVGHHDLAALCSLSFAIGTTAILTGRVVPRDRRFVALSLFSGLGLVLSGSTAAILGLAVGAVAAAVAARKRFAPDGRRLAVVASAVAIVAVGVVALRADPLASFLRFVGTRDDRPQPGIETYSHRTVLLYIGGRIFAANPIVGAGWQRSADADVYLPYVPDAKRRFPDVVPQAFPSATRSWGVQNAYVQAGADLGGVGLVLFLAPFAVALRLAYRAAANRSAHAAAVGLVALTATLTLMGIWTAIGLVAGIPLCAATWLALGVATLPASGALDE